MARWQSSIQCDALAALAERLYDAEADPRSHADVIVDKRNLANPVIRQGPRG